MKYFVVALWAVGEVLRPSAVSEVLHHCGLGAVLGHSTVPLSKLAVFWMKYFVVSLWAVYQLCMIVLHMR